MKSILKPFGIGIALIQIVDILIHVATDQFELIRVTSNLIILVWLVVVVLAGYKTKFLQISSGAIGLYLVLNLIFLANNGLTNPEQGGSLRIVLFVLVFLTVTLSGIMSYRYKKTLE